MCSGSMVVEETIMSFKGAVLSLRFNQDQGRKMYNKQNFA